MGSSSNNFTDNNDCSATPGFTVDVEVKNKMGAIQDNGGPTLTHALLLGNPAIDGATAGVDFDQRGEVRPSACGGYDAGAFELQTTICIQANNDTANTDPNTPYYQSSYQSVHSSSSSSNRSKSSTNNSNTS